MADFTFTLTKLSVHCVSSGDGMSRKMTATVSFTKGGETFDVVMPDMLHDEMRDVMNQVQYALSVETYPSGLAEGEDFTVELIT